jgi:S1-C subfamily serine protease
MARWVLNFAVIVLSLPAPMLTATADPWHLIVARLLEKSVVQLSNNCSGFVVNEQEDYVLTAKHCGEDDLTKLVAVDKIPAKVVATDIQKDLLVLHVPGIDRPALKFATADPVYGQVVASFGYGGGYERPMLRISTVSQPAALVPDAGPGEWVQLGGGFIGGQSGGPVVNEAGEVIAIVQMSTPTMGIGRSAEEIRKQVGKYLQKFPQ